MTHDLIVIGVGMIDSAAAKHLAAGGIDDISHRWFMTTAGCGGAKSLDDIGRRALEPVLADLARRMTGR
jgi:hypothetical protein